MNSYGVVMNDETPTQTADVNNTPNQVPTMSSTGAIPKRRHIKLDVNKEGKIRSCGEGKDYESSSHTQNRQKNGNRPSEAKNTKTQTLLLAKHDPEIYNGGDPIHHQNHGDSSAEGQISGEIDVSTSDVISMTEYENETTQHIILPFDQEEPKKGVILETGIESNYKSACYALKQNLARDTTLKYFRDNFDEESFTVCDCAEQVKPSNFPDVLTLARFSKLCYQLSSQVFKHFQKDPVWDLLAVCTGHYNYQGFAVVSPARQLIILVHRGTVKAFWNFWSNVKVLFQSSLHYQLSAACTFAERVRELACSRGYQLVVTGHSMGGVLAQATGASTKYLQLKKDAYSFCLKDLSKIDSFHPHIVTFDAPGAYKVVKRMLMTNPTCPTLDRATSSLDVTNLVMNPNAPNTINEHFGMVIHVDDSSRLLYWLTGNHSIVNFIHLFEETGQRGAQVLQWMSVNSKLKFFTTVVAGRGRDLADQTAVVEWDQLLIPDYCFTRAEISMLQTILQPREVKLLLDEIRFLEGVELTQENAVKLPVGSKQDVETFVPRVRLLCRENYVQVFERKVNKQISLGLHILKSTSTVFKTAELNKLCLRDCSFLMDTNGEVKHEITLANAGETSLKVMAALVKNSLLSEHPESIPVLMADKATLQTITKCDDTAGIIQTLLSYSQRFLFVFISTGVDEDVQSLAGRINGSNSHHRSIVIKNGQCSIDVKRALAFNNFTEESRMLQQKMIVGYQHEDFKKQLPAECFREMNIVEIGSKVESGKILANTWISAMSEFSNTFYMLQNLLSAQKESMKVEEFLQQTGNTLYILAANPGMGKSSFFIELRKQFAKIKRKRIIILFVSLRKMNRQLETASTQDSKCLEILKQHFKIPDSDPVDRYFFDHFQNSDFRVVYLFDGFDELSFKARIGAGYLIRFFQQHKSTYQIWVSTRFDTVNDLAAPKFEPYRVFDLDLLTDVDQKEYLRRLLEQDTGQAVEKDVEVIFKKMKDIMLEFGKDSLGVPITLKLLVMAQAYKAEVKILKPHNLIEIYLEKKCEFFLVEKLEIDVNVVSPTDLVDFRSNYNFNLFIFYAFYQLFPERNYLIPIKKLEENIFTASELKKIKDTGILDGNYQFFHRTIAEYLIAYALKVILGAADSLQIKHLARWLKDCLDEERKSSNKDVFVAFLRILLSEGVSAVTWKFLDDMLASTEEYLFNPNVFTSLILDIVVRFRFQEAIEKYQLRNLLRILVDFKSMVNNESIDVETGVFYFKDVSTATFKTQRTLIELYLDTTKDRLCANDEQSCEMRCELDNFLIHKAIQSLFPNEIFFQTDVLDLQKGTLLEIFQQKSGLLSNNSQFIKHFQPEYFLAKALGNIVFGNKKCRRECFSLYLKNNILTKQTSFPSRALTAFLLSRDLTLDVSMNFFGFLEPVLEGHKVDENANCARTDLSNLLCELKADQLCSFSFRTFETIELLEFTSGIISFSQNRSLLAQNATYVPFLVKLIYSGEMSESNILEIISKDKDYIEQACIFAAENTNFIFHYIAHYGMEHLLVLFLSKMNVDQLKTSNQPSYEWVPQEKIPIKNIIPCLTPLHLAIIAGHGGIVRILLKEGFDVCPKQITPSPLILAINKFVFSNISDTISTFTMVETLLEFGAITFTNSQKKLFLQSLKDKNMLEVVTTLAGSKEYQGQYLGKDFLDNAKQRLSESVLSAIVPPRPNLSPELKLKVDVHFARCSECKVHFSTFSWYNEVRFVREAVERAALCGIETSVWLRYLLTRTDVDINCRNPDGGHRFLLAALRCRYNQNALEELLQSGADWRTMDVNGLAPVHVAFANNKLDYFSTIAPDSVRLKTSDGKSLLHLLAQRKQNDQETFRAWFALQVVSWQLDPRATDVWGNTPIHYAQNDISCVLSTFLTRGADINAIGRFGQTPLHTYLLRSGCNQQGVDAFLKHGADPSKLADNFLPAAEIASIKNLVIKM